MRLIDADELKADYIRTTTTTNTPCCLYVSKEQIDNAPTIDAEPVVRCKDCKHWVNGFCITEMKFTLAETDFCSWGERKDNETD